jgi:hypothetical protein
MKLLKEFKNIYILYRVFLKYRATLMGVFYAQGHRKYSIKHGSMNALSLSYGSFYFGRRRMKNGMYTRPQESVYLQTADFDVKDYCFDNKLQKVNSQNGFLVLPHSALRVSLRIVAYVKKFQTCYELTRIPLLPYVVVRLHH